MRLLKPYILLFISGLFLAGLPIASAEEESVTVPYSIDGINPTDVMDGKLKDNVIFKKGEKSKTITIKLKKDAKKSSDKEPKFSIGESKDKKVTLGKNKSVAIKLPDTATTTLASGSSSGASKTITIKAGEQYKFKPEDFGSQNIVWPEKLPKKGTICGNVPNMAPPYFCASGSDKRPISSSRITYQSDKDYVGKETFEFKLSSHLGGANKETYTIIINIESVCPEGEELKDGKCVAKNTPPTGANKTIQVIGNDSYKEASEYFSAHYEFPTKDYGFSDADEGDSLYGVKILSLPERGWLEGVFTNGLGGGNPKVGDVLDSSYLDVMRYTPADGESGTVSFKFSVFDGKDFSVPYTMTLDFTAAKKTNTPSIKPNKNIIATPNPIESGGTVSIDASGFMFSVQETTQMFDTGAYTETWKTECSGNFDKATATFDVTQGKIAFNNDTLKTKWTAPQNNSKDNISCEVGFVISQGGGNWYAKNVDITVKPAEKSGASSSVTDTTPLTISLSRVDVESDEGQAGTTEYLFTLIAFEGTPDPENYKLPRDVTVKYTVSGSGTHQADAKDFVEGVLPQGEVTFKQGESAKANIIIEVQGDTDKEQNEEFTLTLQAVEEGIAIGNATVIGSIKDDDGGSTGSDTVFNEINECPSCINGGQCLDGKSCTCPEGFFGEICELQQQTSQQTPKEFKLVENSRKFLLYDSRLIDGISLVQENSFTDAVNAAINCPNDKPFLCSDMETCATSENACTTSTTTTTPAVTPEVCGNFIDDDGDGDTDFADSDCTTAENAGAGNCADGFDNDNDGFPDILEPDCVETMCTDFTDNDGDGATDFADPDCTTVEAPGAGNCADGFDNDNDGLTDGADPDCAPASSALTLVPPLLNDTSFANSIVIVVNGANLSTVIGADADSVANSLFHVQFTGPGSALAVPATGTTVDNTNMLMDGPNDGLGFTRGGITYEINIGLTITSDDDITTDALSGRNCGAGGTAPCP